MSDIDITPCLISLTSLSSKWTIVEGSDEVDSPPSIIRSREESLNWCRASSAVVAAFWPLMFALVPVMGLPVFSHSFTAISWLGIRKPAVFNPPVATSGMQSAFSNTIVSGPGQKLEAKTLARGGTNSEKLFSEEKFWIKIGSGAVGPLCFTSNTFETAMEFVAIPAIPYTVSVGMQTTPPSNSILAACSKESLFAGNTVVMAWHL